MQAVGMRWAGLRYPAAGDEFPDGKTFGVVGSDHHSNINIDSVVVTEADQLTPEDLDVFISARQWTARPSRFRRLQATSP